MFSGLCVASAALRRSRDLGCLVLCSKSSRRYARRGKTVAFLTRMCRHVRFHVRVCACMLADASVSSIMHSFTHVCAHSFAFISVRIHVYVGASSACVIVCLCVFLSVCMALPRSVSLSVCAFVCAFVWFVCVCGRAIVWMPPCAQLRGRHLDGTQRLREVEELGGLSCGKYSWANENTQRSFVVRKVICSHSSPCQTCWQDLHATLLSISSAADRRSLTS